MNKIILTQEILDMVNVVSLIPDKDDNGNYTLVIQCENKFQAELLLVLIETNLFMFVAKTGTNNLSAFKLSFPDSKIDKELVIQGRDILNLFDKEKVKRLTTGWMDNGDAEISIIETKKIIGKANYEKLN